ncbi:MAG: hypothetical protein LBQ61_03040 [Spirochaetales bacterium]|jgi:hypothetical protein|nr:hypothetical protein [Spirochaetales bacterium]
MNSRSAVFIFCYTLLVLAILAGQGYLYYRNRLEIRGAAEKAGREAGQVFSEALRRGDRPGTEGFSRLVKGFYQNYDNLQSLCLYSPEKGVYYFYSPNRSRLSLEDSAGWSGRPVYRSDPRLFFSQSVPLDLKPGEPLIMAETSFFLGFTRSAYPLARTLFLVLAGWLVVGVFALVLSNPSPKAEAAEAEREPGGKTPEGAFPSGAPEPPAAKTAEAAPADSPKAPSWQEVLKKTVFDEPALDRPALGESPLDSPAPPPEGLEAERRDNFSLYSETTGLVRKELLEDKLNQEIKRSAAFDQDLILVIFSFRGWETKAKLRQFQTLIFESFPYRDLVFDYAGGVFALIIPNMDIESVAPVLERFQAKIEKAAPSDNPGFRAGASSRCGRLITAGRLMLESRSAYRKTRAGGGIILFKISPKKFRRVIAEKNYI